MVTIEHLVKRYGSHYALEDVSFSVGEGEIVGLLGPNGAGKSTTMNILTGYLAPTSGMASVNGIDIAENPLEAKKQIGFLPEQPPVYPDMTVEEYLGFVYELKGCALPRREHLEDVMRTVKLGEVKGRLIAHLSKGYKQRVGIAQALIGDPKVLVFDEPTVGLDPKQILEVRHLIRTLGRSHTVILSTHILSEVQAVCGRIIIINKGRIIADEKTEELVRKIEDTYRYEARICGPEREVITALKNLSGVSEVQKTDGRDLDATVVVFDTARGVDVRKALFGLCAERGWPMIGLSPSGTDLESVFVKLIDRSETGSGKNGGKQR